MERNSSTAGGDDSNSKDMIHEGGASDELTPPYRCTYRRAVASVQSLRIQ